MVPASATKPDNLESTWWRGRTSPCKLSSNFYVYT